MQTETNKATNSMASFIAKDSTTVNYAVTITAYKRPHLLKQCLESIEHAISLTPDFARPFSITVSVDHHTEVTYEEMAKVFWDTKRLKQCIPFNLLRQPDRLGVANHPHWLYNQTFQMPIAAILALEEDTIMAPDIFTLAAWSLRQMGKYAFMNFGQMNFGQFPTRVIAPELDRELLVHEDYELRSPFAWMFSRAFWKQLEPHWNGKIREPYGWDWQVTHLCYRKLWRVLTPEVARVYNTGREHGTYDTPESWDASQKNVVLCQHVPNVYTPDGTDRLYSIVAHNRPYDIPVWVQKEMAL